MKQLPSEVKTFPLPDSHLQGAVVAQITIMEAQELVDELGRLSNANAKQIEALNLILKDFSDLLIEATGHRSHLQWLSKQIFQAEREAAKLRLPAWIWRIDPDGDLPAQLGHRAAFLREEIKAHPDDQWDVLSEVLKWAGLEVDEDLLRSAITGDSHARS
jgi:hypothetical protein